MLLGHSASSMNELPFLLILRLFGEDFTTSKFFPAPAKTGLLLTAGRKRCMFSPTGSRWEGGLSLPFCALLKEGSSVVLFPRSALDKPRCFQLGKMVLNLCGKEADSSSLSLGSGWLKCKLEGSPPMLLCLLVSCLLFIGSVTCGYFIC